MAAKLTIDEVRALHLHAQGLGVAPGDVAATDPKGRALEAIQRMKALQIDTISVVARSPYLVLWSRIGDYEPGLLDQLLEEGAVFEYWAHAACFLPREHFATYRRFAISQLTPIQKRRVTWVEANKGLVEQVLARIRDEGPLRSADFERTDGRKGTGWWDWKQEKMALEVLFNLGVLMVRRRQAFQRVYDLAERVRPDLAGMHVPSAEEATRDLIRHGAESLGVARAEWIANHLFPYHQARKGVLTAIREMAKSGELVEVAVEGWKAPGYAMPGWLEKNNVSTADATQTVLLSPFDPVVWDRDRLAELFGFDYRIECYTPAPKRKYGYFSLPILHNGAMAGRLDPKAHRRDGVMEIKSLHLEPDVVPGAELVDALRVTIRRFAEWHRTPEVVVRDTNPGSLKKALGRI